MVSLENKATYLLRINEIPKLTAFNNLLLDRTISLTTKQDLNESDEIYFGILRAIQSNDKTAFDIHYNKKKKSNPSKDSPSPFVNDDFLIFCLIVGIVKFNCDRSWIKNIISIRSRNTITITLEDILNENYYNKSNLPEIVLMYFQLNNQTLITNDFLNTTFKSIYNNSNLFENKSDFQIICAIRAYALIIELKETPDGSEVNLLKEFNSKFLQRIKVLTWIIQTVVLILFLYVLVKLLYYVPSAKIFFDQYDPVFTVIGILGLSLLGNIIPALKRKSYEMLLRIFGYPNELIKELHKKESK